MRFVQICFALLLIVSPGVSQVAKRSVSGIVTDKQGNTLPKSVVQLENSNNQSVASYITGADGRYHFSNVGADTDYTLKARYRNYWSKPRTLSRFDASRTPEVNLVIPID